jgi:hypothetical protein
MSARSSLSGVRVVRLDHVAEQVRGPLIRILQLEHFVVLLLAFPADPGDDQHHRHEQQQRRRMAIRGEGGEEAERGEDEIEAVDESRAPQIVAKRDGDDRALECERRHEVEHELRRDRREIDGHVVPPRHVRQLGPGASALSSPLPVNLLDPYLRFFAHSAGANGSLHVQVYFRGLSGNLTGLLNFGSISPGGFSSWQPTPDVLSTLALPLLTATAQVRLTSQATSGSWQIDDVYLDPRVVKLG